MAVEVYHLDRDFVGRTEFENGFRSELVWVIIVEPAWDELYGYPILVHRPERHYADACLQRKQ